MTIKTIGFIGTGVMGKSMIRHLLKNIRLLCITELKKEH